MQYVIFHREDEKFDDIISDPAVKLKIKTIVRYTGHLVIGIPGDKFDTVESYITLKYGDCIKQWKDLVVCRTPVMNKDYIPARKKV